MMIELSKKINSREILMRCLPIGGDFLVIISGGSEHIGAAALGQYYSKRDGSANSSVISVLGHKESEPAMKTAEYLSKVLKTNTAVIAGIHFDNLSPAEINEILAAIQELSDQLAVRILKS